MEFHSKIVHRVTSVIGNGGLAVPAFCGQHWAYPSSFGPRIVSVSAQAPQNARKSREHVAVQVVGTPPAVQSAPAPQHACMTRSTRVEMVAIHAALLLLRRVGEQAEPEQAEGVPHLGEGALPPRAPCYRAAVRRCV